GDAPARDRLGKAQPEKRIRALPSPPVESGKRPTQRSPHRGGPLGNGGRSRRADLPVRAGAQEVGDGGLQRNRRLEIGGLLDAGEPIDDRPRRGDPADPESRNEVLGQRAEPHGALRLGGGEWREAGFRLLVSILDDEGTRG